MTTVYFVRHAQPNYENHNDAHRELSEKGMKDRKRVTEFLSNQKIDAVLSSPYKRAIDTVKDFADTYGLEIGLVENFKERKVSGGWIGDFTEFAEKQWNDFNFKLPDGESLKEVQTRNIEALNQALDKYADQNIVIGSHGTALSTIINFYDPSFGYDDFNKIKDVMPWIVRFQFDEERKCTEIDFMDV